MTVPPLSSFSFILACLLPDVSLSTTCSDCLIYHRNQIWKCRSLHQGPDTLLRVQSGGIMGGRSTSRLLCYEGKCGEWVWGCVRNVRGRRRREKKNTKSPYFHDKSLLLSEKKKQLWRIGGVSVDISQVARTWLTLRSDVKSNKWTMIISCLSSRTHGRQRGSYQQCGGVVVKMETCLRPRSRAKSVTAHVC